MNKKVLIIAASVLIFTVIGVSFFLFSDKKAVSTNTDVTKAANNFVETWYTYTTQTDKSYLAKVKPLMTENLYQETEYVHTQRPRDFEGQEASSVTIDDTKLALVDKNYAEVSISATQKEGKDNISLILNLNLVKDGDKWLVSYFSPSTE